MRQQPDDEFRELGGDRRILVGEHDHQVAGLREVHQLAVHAGRAAAMADADHAVRPGTHTKAQRLFVSRPGSGHARFHQGSRRSGPRPHVRVADGELRHVAIFRFVAGRGHAERLEEVSARVVVVRLTADHLDDATEQDHAVVAVIPARAGRERRAAVAEELEVVLVLARLEAMIEVLGREDVAGAAGVREQLLDGHGRHFLVRVVRQVSGDRRVERELARLNELQRGYRREHLAHGAEAESRVDIVPAVGALDNGLAVLGDQQCAGEFLGGGAAIRFALHERCRRVVRRQGGRGEGEGKGKQGEEWAHRCQDAWSPKNVARKMDAVDETNGPGWRSHPQKTMFTLVKRWKRILVQVLVVAQLLSAAPLASARPASKDADSMPCAEMMGMASAAADSRHCPCCPDGADSVAACLAACVAASGIISSLFVSLVRADPTRVSVPIATAHSRAFDPPLKPPPIA
jgi:hypothetical protein